MASMMIQLSDELSDIFFYEYTQQGARVEEPSHPKQKKLFSKNCFFSLAE